MAVRFILLEAGVDYTLTAYANHLNMVHGNKKSDSPFTTDDVQKYAKRGKLPEYLGGNEVEEVVHEEMGIKMIKIKPNIK